MFNDLICPTDQAAKRLLGCVLERTINEKIIRARIVETEAYDQNDPGSHTFCGKTKRNEIMFEKAGFLYVYFIYGMHYCCNVVTGPQGFGEAALIRAVEPIYGHDEMKLLRNGHDGVTISNGPSKLCKALDISKDLNGHYLSREPLKLLLMPEVSPDNIVTTKRIGLSKGQDKLWRFYIKDNKYISKK